MVDVLYLSHGGGPLPLLGDASHRSMVDFLSSLAGTLSVPDVILVVSAHWEASVPSFISTRENPGLLYDYYGFPRDAYSIAYPVKSDAPVVTGLVAALKDRGFVSEVVLDRGFDHGVFIPLKLMFPKADIPVVQVSLLDSLDPLDHVMLGEVLRGFNNSRVLVVGSGFSFHNMHEFFDAGGGPDSKNDAFQDWLVDVCTNGEYDFGKRKALLVNWEGAPHARYCHPREEHLLPLHVCVGMAGDSIGKKVFDDFILGKRSVAFHWSF